MTAQTSLQTDEQMRCGKLSPTVSRRVLLGLSCLGPIALSGCGSLGVDGSMAAAQVRFVDVSPGSPEMDFYLNGTAAAYSVGYANFTSYLPVAPGTATVSVRRAGTGLTSVTGDMNFTAGRQYTAVLLHGPGSAVEHIYPDQDTPAPAGQMALRVLNAVEPAAAITVYVTPGSNGAAASPAAVLSVSSGAASAYLNVPFAPSYTVTATVAEGTLNVPLSTVTVKAGSGAVRTVVFAGTTPAGPKSVVGFALDDADAQ